VSTNTNHIRYRLFIGCLLFAFLAPLDGTVTQANMSEEPVSGAGGGELRTDHWPVPPVEATPEATLKAAEAALPAPLEDTFRLHSCPGSTKVIYLDFDGFIGTYGTYTPWDLDGSPSTFSGTERTIIQQVWQSVSEDFIPFAVDVTMEDPGVNGIIRSNSSDQAYGARAVIDGSAKWDYSWAYMNTFDDSKDVESFIYKGNNTWIWIADSISHEIGHTLGLDEHGQKPGDGVYYEGHGSGDTFWAPIMGWTKMTVPYGLSQWDKGEYLNANHSEDSLNIITTQNGFGYRPDDHGSTPATATPISINNSNLEFVAEGIIEQPTDRDYFAFTMSSTGPIRFIINPDNLAANLDIIAKIHDASGSVFYISNPSDALSAEFQVTLNAGDYYLSIDGTGLNDPLGPPADGYSDYGSLGYYSIEAIGGGSSDLAPSVDAGVDMITWSGRPVQLAPNIVNNDPCDPQASLTYLWTADPAAGVVFDPNAYIEDPTVTITKAPGDAVTFTLTLAVHDGVHPTVQDTMTIDVYDDACQAAIGMGLAADYPADFDRNCVINFADFALMATAWLDDNSLTVPVAK
jgi:hypothetical protein